MSEKKVEWAIKHVSDSAFIYLVIDGIEHDKEIILNPHPPFYKWRLQRAQSKLLRRFEIETNAKEWKPEWI